MDGYDFDAQLKQGERYEKLLDRHFQAWFSIAPASEYDQRNGIDRIFTRKIDRCVFTVEYKADFQAHQTGNVFIEMVSVDKRNKRGWVLQTRAQVIAYYIVRSDRVYLLYAADIKTMLPRWVKEYPQGSAQNKGRGRGDSYASSGILVPLGAFTRYSFNDYDLHSWL